MMKKNFIKNLFALALVLGAIALILPNFGTKALAAEEHDAKPDDYYSYVQKFDDVDSVNNAFHAYYLENALGSAKAELVSTSATAVDSHWYIEGGVISRINDVKKSEITNNYETNQVAVLTFTKEAYLNFELSVDYKCGPSGFWPVVAIRQLEEGKYYLDDGAGVLVQHNGTVTLWGDANVSGPYEFSLIENYKRDAWHNMQIKVLGNTLYVSIDNQPYKTQALPEEFYETGYVSLCSVNNETQYRNFRIKALAEPQKEDFGDFAPQPEASTDDALSNLAGGVINGTPDEREDKVNPDLIYEAEVEVTYTEGGCGGMVSATGGAVILAVAAITLIINKKIIY